jgi:chitodextrinase
VKDLLATPRFLVAAGEFTDANGTGQSYVATYPVVPDLRAPGAPHRLTAAVTAARWASLTWNAATDNVGVTGYRVVRNGVVLSPSVAGPSFTDTALKPNTTYTYSVRALDAAGNVSRDSERLSVTTLAPSSEVFSVAGPSGAGPRRAESAVGGSPVSFAGSFTVDRGSAAVGPDGTFGWESAYGLMAGDGVELTHASLRG